MSGEVWLDGTELLAASDETVRRARGAKMAMIFQDPLSALHPYYTIGDQIDEALPHPQQGVAQAGTGPDRGDARSRRHPERPASGRPVPARVLRRHAPARHDRDGAGNNPKLLIADEPTTALDVTVQAQILELMKDLQRDFGSAIVMITHDLGVVADIADDVLVMYGGKAVETGSVIDVYYNASHPYTWGLLNSMPRLDRTRADRLDPIPGTPPSLITLPPGCSFNPRCTFTQVVGGNRCRTEVPELTSVGPDHCARCFLTADQRQKAMVDSVATPEETR